MNLLIFFLCYIIPLAVAGVMTRFLLGFYKVTNETERALIFVYCVALWPVGVVIGFIFAIKKIVWYITNPIEELGKKLSKDK